MAHYCVLETSNEVYTKDLGKIQHKERHVWEVILRCIKNIRIVRQAPAYFKECQISEEELSSYYEKEKKKCFLSVFLEETALK